MLAQAQLFSRLKAIAKSVGGNWAEANLSNRDPRTTSFYHSATQTHSPPSQLARPLGLIHLVKRVSDITPWATMTNMN